MYCHNALGIVGVEPPPPVCGTTSRTSRVVVWWPLMSVALRRMMDPAQLRAGYGGFTQAFAPSEKIVSPAARSGATPSSCIFMGNSQTVPDPYQVVIVAYTEFGFRSPSGSVTFAKRQKPSPAWTGSIASVAQTPSVHLSMKTGGRVPWGAFIGADHRTMLFRLSTMMIVIWSEDRRLKLLYSQRSPMSHTLLVPSKRPLGVTRKPLNRCRMT